ncbi:MAG: hypothetical protein LDLANPLL_00627 [Turneriella sp.]|nr:hypothetical protein [Turneriella sp.]
MAEKDREHKRELGRLKVMLDGQYRFIGETEWSPCGLVNLSTRGLALVGKQSFYEGDKIEVRFSIEKRSIQVTVEITNLFGKKAGGKILEIADKDRSIIQEVLNRVLLSGSTTL